MDHTLQVDDYYDTIVIGSGIGGLTAAAFLSKCCLERVLVLEQHPTTLGGCTHEFERKGIEFDTGVHYIGGDMWDAKNSVFRRIFDFITDDKVQWMKMEDNFDRTTVEGQMYEIRSGIAQQRHYLKQRFPSQPIDEYFDDVQKTFSRYSKFLMAQIGDAYLPKMFVERALKDATFGEETVEKALDRLKVTNPKLRKVLTYHYGDYGYDPSRSSYVQHCLTVCHYANGSSYPVQGPHMIADSVQTVVEKYGGKMMTNSRVKSIFIENGEAKGVFLERMPNRPVRAKNIISDAGAFNTYVKLIDEVHLSLSPILQRAREAFNTGELEPSPGFAMVFAVFTGPQNELNVPSGNLWVQDAPDFPYVFLSFPSTRDPSWAERHPNECVCEIIVEAKYDDYVGIPEEEYQAKKKAIAKLMLKEAYRQYPRLGSRLKFYVSSTPRTLEKFLGSRKGCAYGVAPSPARFRANREWMKPQTPVKNLFMAGQDLVSPGLCGGLMGGLLAASSASSKCLLKSRELIYPLGMGKL